MGLCCATKETPHLINSEPIAILAFHPFFKAVNKLNRNTFSTIYLHWTTSVNISHVWEIPGQQHVTCPSKSDLDQFAAASLGQSIKLIRVRWKVKWGSPCLVPWHVICPPMWSIWQRSLMQSWQRGWLAEQNEPTWAPSAGIGVH